MDLKRCPRCERTFEDCRCTDTCPARPHTPETCAQCRSQARELQHPSYSGTRHLLALPQQRRAS